MAEFNIIVSIKTETGYDEIIDILDKMGYRWGSDNRLKEQINSIPKEKTYLYLSCEDRRVYIDTGGWANEKNAPVMSFEGFLKPMVDIIVSPNLNNKLASILKIT